MQHITVNLVLSKINLKCFYSNKDLILLRLLLPLCWWHRKCFAQGVALVAGSYKHLFILQCLFQTLNEIEISQTQAVWDLCMFKQRVHIENCIFKWTFLTIFNKLLHVITRHLSEKKHYFVSCFKDAEALYSVPVKGQTEWTSGGCSILSLLGINPKSTYSTFQCVQYSSHV